jgi:hypothetical protein
MKRLMQRSKLHPYSITSSARARSVRGTVSPMAPAQADQQVFTPEDAIYISRRYVPLIDLIRAIGDQTAVRYEIPIRIYRWQP